MSPDTIEGVRGDRDEGERSKADLSRLLEHLQSDYADEADGVSSGFGPEEQDGHVKGYGDHRRGDGLSAVSGYGELTGLSMIPP